MVSAAPGAWVAGRANRVLAMVASPWLTTRLCVLSDACHDAGLCQRETSTTCRTDVRADDRRQRPASGRRGRPVPALAAPSALRARAQPGPSAACRSAPPARRRPRAPRRRGCSRGGPVELGELPAPPGARWPLDLEGVAGDRADVQVSAPRPGGDRLPAALAHRSQVDVGAGRWRLPDLLGDSSALPCADPRRGRARLWTAEGPRRPGSPVGPAHVLPGGSSSGPAHPVQAARRGRSPFPLSQVSGLTWVALRACWCLARCAREALTARRRGPGAGGRRVARRCPPTPRGAPPGRSGRRRAVPISPGAVRRSRVEGLRARCTVRSSSSQRPSRRAPSSSSTAPGGACSYGARVARSRAGSQKVGRYRPSPSAPRGSRTSRARPPTSTCSR